MPKITQLETEILSRQLGLKSLWWSLHYQLSVPSPVLQEVLIGTRWERLRPHT